MLPTGRRLRRSREFTATVRAGRRAGSPHRLLVAHLDMGSPPAVSPLAPARAGFVVSRAVGGAVVRATVKRRLRHLVATRLDTLPAGSALVIRALPASAHADSAALGADLDAALTRLLGSGRRS